jgi:transcription antitermination protein NusB
VKVSARRRARELAVQALYSWQMTDNAVEEVELNLATQNDMKQVDMTFFQDMLRYVVKNYATVDAAYMPYVTDRDEKEIDLIERAILRLATYELMQRVDVPYKVVINEAIELSKSFGAADSHKFVNGVLDKAVRILRKDEIA